MPSEILATACSKCYRTKRRCSRKFVGETCVVCQHTGEECSEITTIERRIIKSQRNTAPKASSITKPKSCPSDPTKPVHGPPAKSCARCYRARRQCIRDEGTERCERCNRLDLSCTNANRSRRPVLSTPNTGLWDDPSTHDTPESTTYMESGSESLNTLAWLAERLSPNLPTSPVSEPPLPLTPFLFPFEDSEVEEIPRSEADSEPSFPALCLKTSTSLIYDATNRDDWILSLPDLSNASLSFIGASEDLAGKTISTTICRQLVDIFFDDVDVLMPLYDYKMIRRRVHENGFQLSELPLLSKIAIGMLIAFGARISDSPYIVGKHPMQRDLLPFAPDPSPWGVARHHYCRQLESNLVSLIESSDIYQRPSLEGYSLLMLMSVLYKATNTDWRASEPWRAGAQDIMVRLAGEQRTPLSKIVYYSHMILTADFPNAVATGGQPNLALKALFGPLAAAQFDNVPHLESFRAAFASNKPSDRLKLLYLLYIQIGRTGARDVLECNLEKIAALLQAIDALFAGCYAMGNNSVVDFLAMLSESPPEESVNRMLRLFVPINLALLAAIRSRLEESSKWDPRAAQLFRHTQQRLIRLSQMQAFIWSSWLKRHLTLGCTVGHDRTIQSLLRDNLSQFAQFTTANKLDLIAEAIISAPIEDGLTTRQKRLTLQWALDALSNFSFSWPHTQPYAELIRDELAKYEDDPVATMCEPLRYMWPGFFEEMGKLLTASLALNVSALPFMASSPGAQVMDASQITCLPWLDDDVKYGLI